MLETTFTVQQASEQSFVVRWTHTAGPEGSPAHRVLETCLEGIEGVERVYLRRYSAELWWATHMTVPVETVRERLQAALAVDAMVRYEWPTIHVTLVPGFLEE